MTDSPWDADPEPRRPAWMPSQVLDRIGRGLSPVDDSLPFAQAVRHHGELRLAAERRHDGEVRVVVDGLRVWGKDAE